MKKVPFIKRLTVFALCLGMILGGNLSALATESPMAATEATEAKEDGAVTTEAEETKTAATETEEDETVAGEAGENRAIDEKEKQVYTYENDEVVVEATTDSKTFSSDVKLEVTPITEGSAYKEVEAQLAEDASANDYKVAGFLAYDIRFVDGKGKEVEPDGTVSVSMNYKEAAIPEGMEQTENTSVAVMHLEENNDAVEVKDISGDSNVNTTTGNAVDKVEFVTESFSTFTITWKWWERYDNWWGNFTHTTKICQVDESGTGIGSSDDINLAEVSAANNKENHVNVKAIGEEHPVEGYTFVGAYVKLKNSEKVYVTDISYNSNTGKLYYIKQGETTWTEWVVEYFNIYTPTYMYLEYRPAGAEMETLDTASRGVDITLFDYKVNTANNSNEAIGSVGSGKDDGEGINKGHYLKFMNSASGGKPEQNQYTGGSKAREGIVADTLEDGYPKLADWGQGESLSYLFDDQDIKDVKKVYADCNYLFYDEDGYYSYDSAAHFATLSGNTDNHFTVTERAGSGFFPFTALSYMNSDINATTGDVLGGSQINHYFGLTMSTDFVQTANGQIQGKDMVFEFSGDDDVWVFIDDKLVLDIGGIHDAVSGSINFATGKSVVNSNGQEIVKNFADIFDLDGEDTFEDFSTHTMKFYYLERGHHASNCKIKFNLPTIPKGNLYVSKTATETAEGDTSDYEFVIRNEAGAALANASYKLNTDAETHYTDGNGKFTLKSGQYALFGELEAGNYYVTETNVLNSPNAYNLNQFSTKVSVNGTVQTIYDASDVTARTAGATVSDAASCRFEFKNILNKSETTKTGSELSKVIRYNEADDNYDLTLSFKGPEETETTTVTDTTIVTEKAKLDVVMVFDNSASMNDENRLRTAKEAAGKLIDSIEENSNIDARWKLITFERDAETKTGNDWVNGQTQKQEVNAIRCGNGTNYQAGLVRCAKELESSREDAKTIVIFLTDGQPTFHMCKKHGNHNSGNGWNYNCNCGDKYLSNDGSACRGGGSGTNYTDYTGALMGAKAIECDAMYSVGINLVDRVYNGMSGETVLANVTNASKAAEKSTVNKDVSELVATFQNIAEKIKEDVEIRTITTTYYATAVTVSDRLSQYVDVVEGSEFAISVKDASGQEVGSAAAGILGGENAKNATYQIGDALIVAEYDANKRTMTMAFPENYELGQGYTYSFTFKVDASEKAYEEYANTGYPHVGEEGTDAAGNNTSSGKAGFRSNDEAKVTYRFRDSSVDEYYKHPVVQIQDRYNWNLVKASATNNDLKLAGAKFRLTQARSEGEPLVYFGLSGENGLVSWYLDAECTNACASSDILDGTYTLEEIEAPVGYALDDTVWNISVSKAVGLQINAAADSYEESTDLLTDAEGKEYTQTLIFENEAVYSLPETGGRGILLYTISGMLMMMGGALFLFLSARKRTICK